MPSPYVECAHHLTTATSQVSPKKPQSPVHLSWDPLFGGDDFYVVDRTDQCYVLYEATIRHLRSRYVHRPVLSSVWDVSDHFEDVSALPWNPTFSALLNAFCDRAFLDPPITNDLTIMFVSSGLQSLNAANWARKHGTNPGEEGRSYRDLYDRLVGWSSTVKHRGNRLEQIDAYTQIFFLRKMLSAIEVERRRRERSIFSPMPWSRVTSQETIIPKEYFPGSYPLLNHRNDTNTQFHGQT